MRGWQITTRARSALSALRPLAGGPSVGTQRIAAARSILRPWARRDPLNRRSVDHVHPEVGIHTNLAREPGIGREFILSRQSLLLGWPHRRRVSAQDLHTAGRAPRIA